MFDCLNFVLSTTNGTLTEHMILDTTEVIKLMLRLAPQLASHLHQ